MILNPINSLFSGILLGLCVLSFRLFFGKVLGISGMTHLMFKGRSESLQSFFILGLFTSGLLFLKDSKDSFILPSSVLFQSLAGFLVGLGTKLASGCTSGHGLCGLSSWKKRSWVAVPVFMFSAMVTRTGLLDDFSTQQPIEIQNHLSPHLPLLFSICIALFPVLFALRAHDIPFLSSALGYLYGIVFGYGLISGEMTQYQKVLDFLSLPSLFFNIPSGFTSKFDPSLMILMMGGLLPSLLFNPWVNKIKKPWVSHKWDLSRASHVDFRLITGSCLFGMGWGMMGICPGPSIVLLSQIVYGNFFMIYWISGYAFASIVASMVL